MKNSKRRSISNLSLSQKKDKLIQQFIIHKPQNQIKILTNNQPIQVLPSQIVFKNVQPNQSYEINVQVRNLTKNAMRIRFQKTTNPRITVQYNLQPEIAPGLSIFAKIKYQCQQLYNQTQIVRIITQQGHNVELPVRIYKMQSQIVFDPYINLGFLKLGQEYQRKIKIKNTGKTNSVLKFTHQHNGSLIVQPQLMEIKGLQTEQLFIKYKSLDPGIFRGRIQVSSESILVKQQIEVHATVVDYSRFLVDQKGNLIANIDFGTMYVGEEIVKKAFFVNNSPKPLSFKIVFRKGNLQSPQQFSMVQTPNQIGLEQSERVMFCYPEFGSVQPFSELQLNMICKTNITYRQRIYTTSFALSGNQNQGAITQKKNSSDFKPQNTYEYSMMLKVQDQNQPVIISMKGNAVCPEIKLSQSFINFGVCKVNQRLDDTFIIKNENAISNIGITFPKTPSLILKPNYCVIQPLGQKQFKIFFEPKTIGKIDSVQTILINRIYSLELRCVGISSSSSTSSLSKLQHYNPNQSAKLQRSGSLPKINNSTSYVSDSPIKIFSKNKAFSISSGAMKGKGKQPQIWKLKLTKQQQVNKLKLNNQTENKEKYNKYLSQKYIDRKQKEKEQKTTKKFSLYQQKINKIKQKNFGNQDQDIPIDYEFQVGIDTTAIGPQRISLPQANQKLYVTRHIGQYEPPATKLRLQKYNPNIQTAPKKIWPQKPQNYNHRRQVSSQLTPQQLSQIQIGTSSISFGQIYIKSKPKRYLWIRNSTKKAISMRIQIKNQQLAGSYTKTQIIHSGHQAGFEIQFFKQILGDFQGSIKYFINEVHQFQIEVLAKSVPVNIKTDINQLFYKFQETSLQMQKSQSITLTNPGNSDAVFKFILGKDRYFVPQIIESTLKSKQTIKVPIHFVVPLPNSEKSQYKYAEKLIIKVNDGADVPINCSCTLLNAKFTIKAPNLTAPVLCVGHHLQQTFQVKNNSKFPIVLHITGKILQIDQKIRLNPEQNKKFKVRYIATQQGDFDGQIVVRSRGGKPKIFKSKITSIEPIVQFSDYQIQMGVLVVKGIPGLCKFSLKNKTKIDLPLIFDLRPQTVKPQNPLYLQDLTIKCLDENVELQIVSPAQKSDPKAFQQIKQGINLVGQQVNEDEFDENQSQDEQVIQQKNNDQYRKYRIQIKPNVVYNFQMQFFPKQAGNYQITPPVSIEGAKKIEGITLISQAIKPQFLFQPNVVDFQRKIVTRPDRNYPKFISVVVKNLENQGVNWQLRIDQSIKKDGIFGFDQIKGYLKGLQSHQFKISFNPYTIGQFQERVELYIKNQKLSQAIKNADIILKGQASLPRIYFNKRQVVLPVVPIGIQTNTNFRILNDGYQNSNLKFHILDDVANLGLKITFPEGPNIGITKQKIRIDVFWKYHKPMSFTLRVQFFDQMNRSYIIPISGTTDNSIMTNYTYFLKNQDKFIIKTSPYLELVQSLEAGGTLQSIPRKGSAKSLRSNMTGKSLLSYIGGNPINQSILTATIDYIIRYLNSNLLMAPINDFPGSLIESDGSQIFEAINFVSGKIGNYPYKYASVNNQKPVARVAKMYNQYNQLIKSLKAQGALLNNIRPQYLLSFSDLNTYLNTMPEQKGRCFMPALHKINIGLFNYLSTDSWINLFYQIIKIYMLSRVTPKNFQAHLLQSPQIPKYYLEGSNFSSSSQNILFLWVETAVHEVMLQQRRLTNWDKDFKDSILISCLIQKYASIPILKKLKTNCVEEDDFKNNALALCQVLQQIGLKNHLSARDIYSPLARDMLLFILHLYIYLPFYAPKKQVVMFKCILGQQVIRIIQLTNPSSRAVTYKARYSGNQDFTLLGQDAFTIESKATYKYQVKFSSRLSKPSKGRVTFINIKEDNLTAAALVFDLQSQILGRISDKIWNISSPLYQQIQFNIEVQNKFTTAQSVQFAVTYETQYIFQGKNKKVTLSKNQQTQVIFGKQQSIKIKKGGKSQLLLNYIPLSLYKTRTVILFMNPIIGQFQHQILAFVQPPAIIAQIRPPMSLHVQQSVNFEFPITIKNQSIIRAKKVIQAIKKGKKGPTKTGKQTNKTTQTLINQFFKIQIPHNQYASVKDEILITQKKEQDRQNKSVVTETNPPIQNKLIFSIICKNPVYQFTTFVTLYNKNNTDVRRYKLIFTIQPKPLKALLQMTVPARNQVTQNLPIVNNTQRDWNIKIVWQPNTSQNGNYFSINPQYGSIFSVKKNSIGNFPITFKPKWAYRAQAKLTMSNPLTLDHFQYEIIGIGQQPLAQEHIEIKCEAKQIVKKQLVVKNPYPEKPIVLNVETDLANFRGLPKLIIPSGGKQTYQFTVQPILCGQYTGSLTFQDQESAQYIWYTCSITTNFPKAFKSLQITGQVGQIKIQSFVLPFQIQETTTFNVIINGDCLDGASTYTINPQKFQPYKLRFAPLLQGNFYGSIAFINQNVGQTLYELSLKCIKRPPIIISNLKSPLGVSTLIKAQIINPTNYKAFVKISNSNPQQFVIKLNSLKLGPLQKKQVQIQYIPASLDSTQSATVKFVSKQIGQWTYQLSGIGAQPVPFSLHLIYNGLKQEHTTSLKFKNPFKYSIVVGIRLIADNANNNVFKLLNHGKDRYQLQSFQILQIPISFTPLSCMMYDCKVLVMISQKMFWTFPIRGVTQINKGTYIADLTVQCRHTISHSSQISLEGVQNFNINNQYSYHLQNVPVFYQKLIEKFLLIQNPKNKLNHQKDSLEFQFVFKPMKPGKVSFDFVITRKLGSRWRYRVNLEATEPEPDDIINIQSSLLITSTVAFKLTNTQKNISKFKARFTSDSAHQFSIDPKQGQLAPFGTKGTPFYVSFTPAEYGKDKKGKLIIETQQMFWSYLLKGHLPKYIPPTNPGRLNLSNINPKK